MLDIKLSSARSYNKLKNFVFTVSRYPNFDSTQDIVIYTDAVGNFLGFESVKYKLVFYNTDVKLSEFLQSSQRQPAKFNDLENFFKVPQPQKQ